MSTWIRGVFILVIATLVSIERYQKVSRIYLGYIKVYWHIYGKLYDTYLRDLLLSSLFKEKLSELSVERYWNLQLEISSPVST